MAADIAHGSCTDAQPVPVPPKRSPVHLLMDGAERPHLRGVPAAVPHLRRPDANSIAFITHSADTGQMLDHIWMQAEPPSISPARGPPLWEDCDAQAGEGARVESDWATDWDGAGQPAPDYEVD